MIRSKYIALIWLSCVGAVMGGMRIDLRPDGVIVTPGSLPSICTGPGTYHVQVYLVDTGNPTLGNINFRGLFLDFSDTVPGMPPGTQFHWVNPFGIGAVFPDLPITSWVYPLPFSNPLFQNVLPDNGEVLIGDFDWTITPTPQLHLLDVTNQDNPDANFGARADFGFGGPGDPVTTWRAFTGEITGGKLMVCPEPTSMVLLVFSLVIARRRPTSRAR